MSIDDRLELPLHCGSMIVVSRIGGSASAGPGAL